MAKKRSSDESRQNGVHSDAAAVTGGIAEGVTSPPTVPPNPTPQTKQPAENKLAASFAAQSDRTTRIEVAVWAKLITVSEVEEYTQYSLTMSRTWNDKDGNSRGNGLFRIHDVPVLLYLVEQAYNWCIAQRTQVHIESTEPLPF